MESRTVNLELIGLRYHILIFSLYCLATFWVCVSADIKPFRSAAAPDTNTDCRRTIEYV